MTGICVGQGATRRDLLKLSFAREVVSALSGVPRVEALAQPMKTRVAALSVGAT